MFHVKHLKWVKKLASYTMQLKDVIDELTIHEATNTRDRIERGRLKLFDFDYPIFDETYKKVWETNFIRNFYMREIGFETDGLFKFQLESWLLINMPYYNKLFESELIEFDPLINAKIDVTHVKKNDKTQNDVRDTSHEATTSGTSHSDSDSTSDTTTTTDKDSTGSVTDDNFNRTLKSNNPDNRLNLSANDGEGVIEYASEITENNENDKSTSVGNETGTGTNHTTDNQSADTVASSTSDATQNDKLNSVVNDVEDFIEHRAGKVGIQTYSQMLSEYRSTFMRIEKQMHKEMQELFMQVY